MSLDKSFIGIEMIIALCVALFHDAHSSTHSLKNKLHLELLTHRRVPFAHVCLVFKFHTMLCSHFEWKMEFTKSKICVNQFYWQICGEFAFDALLSCKFICKALFEWTNFVWDRRGRGRERERVGKKMKTIESNLIHIIGYWYLSD